MPILKLIRYKSGTDFRSSVMRNVIGYCLQPSKTKIREEIFSVTGQNCVPAIAYNQFMATKASWGKTDGLLFRHYVQSFSPDENITPLQANEIAGEFAAKAWTGYEVLIATHVDRAHIHSHMIVNTVHPDTGKKLHESPDNLKKLRAISDEICRSHGIATLPPYRKTKVHGIGNGEYRKAIQGESWKFHLCGAITLAMARSLSREDFIEAMRLQGYGVRWEDGRKQITYTCYRDGKCKDGSYRKCRDNRLHDEKFLKENMKYEFIIRQNLRKAFARRADETEYAGAASGRNAVPGNDQIDSLRETVLQMQATASALARRAAQIQETLKEMEVRHRKDWQTIENLQKEMKTLLRDKEQQVGNLLDRTSLQIEKFNRRDLITRWALNILFALLSLLILVLVILQGLLPLFRF